MNGGSLLAKRTEYTSRMSFLRFLILTMAASMSVALASPVAAKTLIHAGRLIDGRADAVRTAVTVVVEGDQRLFNQYGVMLVNPAKHAHVKKSDGMAFVNWVISLEGQKAIGDYKIGGEQLYFPNAKSTRSGS